MSTVSMSPCASPRFLTEAEVAQHRTKDSCWVLLGTRVYDVTAFLRMHPGGEALILRRSGRDVGGELEGPPHRHSENARRWLEQYYIGELDRRNSSSDDSEQVKQVRAEEPGGRCNAACLQLSNTAHQPSAEFIMIHGNLCPTLRAVSNSQVYANNSFYDRLGPLWDN